MNGSSRMWRRNALCTLALTPLVLFAAARAMATDPPMRLRFVSVADEEGVTFCHQKGMTRSKMLPETYGAGVALADLTGDGRLDLYFVNSGSLTAGRGSGAARASNGLFLNGGPRTTPRFRDAGAMAGATGEGYGMGVLAGDYDGDGDVDLFTTEIGADRLYANDGQATFVDASADAGFGAAGWGTSSTFVDIDRDGDLDLFVVDYVQFDPADNPWCGRADLGLRFYCDPRKFKPTVDRLYINELVDGGAGGEPRFRQEGASRGITRAGNGLGVVAADFDADGDTDLYVANDMTANFLYHNDGGGVFDERGLLLGAAMSADGAAQAGMGVDAGDFDGDGDVDLVVTNYQLEHNALYRNEGQWWTETSFPSGLGETSLNFLGFGTGFSDFDNDGWLDLFVANGHVHDNIEAFDPIVTHAQRPQMFHNVRGAFTEVVAVAGSALAVANVGRGSAHGDFDDDGDIDVVVNNNGGPATLLRNESVGGNWLRLSLTGRGANRQAIGAQVTLQTGDRLIAREVTAGRGYLSSSETTVHLGLGDETQVPMLRIRWPDGTTQQLTNVQHGQVIVVQQPAEQ